MQMRFTLFNSIPQKSGESLSENALYWWDKRRVNGAYWKCDFAQVK